MEERQKYHWEIRHLNSWGKKSRKPLWITAKDLKDDLIKASVQTTWTHLHTLPHLPNKHIKSHLEYARRNLDWPVEFYRSTQLNWKCLEPERQSLWQERRTYGRAWRKSVLSLAAAGTGDLDCVIVDSLKYQEGQFGEQCDACWVNPIRWLAEALSAYQKHLLEGMRVILLWKTKK